jgi:hypothetical protein
MKAETLNRRRRGQLRFLRSHPELWGAPLKTVVSEMKSARLIAAGTWWEDCTGILRLIERARALAFRGSVADAVPCSVGVLRDSYTAKGCKRNGGVSC